MKLRKPHRTSAEAFELPVIVQLDKNLYVAAFRVLKILPARFILNRAIEAGKLPPKGIVIETTSGTFGLGLALVCNQLNYPLILVSDPVIDPALKGRLEELGTRVEIIRNPAEVGGFQGARLARIAELQAEHTEHFWPSQYDNPHHPMAYAPLAELFVEAVGELDCLVGTVGSGGSMCGTSKYLREINPKLYTIGVDTQGSVLFGQPDQKRLVRGLGNSLMPKNLDHSVFDEIHWVSAAEAFKATRLLHRQHALFMGGTSGAAYLVARWWAQQNPNATVVAILPDEGYRYQDTIYNDQWLRDQGAWLDQLPTEPKLVSYPIEVQSSWSRIRWQRRTYFQVLGHPFQQGGK